MDEATRAYENIGKSPYSGVTIDFEGLKGPEIKAGFTSFLTLLSEQLKSRGMTLYVAVQPALSDGIYFDGFDYRAIGRLADKVILMAHDYNATSLEGFVGTTWHKTTALTPISSVYYSFRAITDINTGVEEKSKIVLALSFATIGWELSENDMVMSPTSIKPASSIVRTRLMQEDTIKGWSEVFRNPYMTYSTEEGRRFFLWYEDARSVSEKINLARLFGINGVSLWRIGIIPDFTGEYDVWNIVSGR
jgi:spore germination protein YaaH